MIFWRHNYTITLVEQLPVGHNEIYLLCKITNGSARRTGYCLDY